MLYYSLMSPTLTLRAIRPGEWSMSTLLANISVLRTLMHLILLHSEESICKALSAFRITLEQSLRFPLQAYQDLNLRLLFSRQTLYPTELYAICREVLLLLLYALLGTKYNTPHIFHLASYSTVFREFYISNTALKPFCANNQTIELPVSC